MLAFYHRLASRLKPVRLFFWLLGAVAITAFGATLFGPAAWRVEVFNVLSMTLLLWAVLGTSVIHGFAAPLPTFEGVEGRWQRLLVAVQRFLLGVFALFLSGLAFVTLFASVRALGMFMRWGG